jgi:hypothetical protein
MDQLSLLDTTRELLPVLKMYIKGMAEVPGTRATHSYINGHWNGFPDFQETIHGDPGPPRRLRA